MLDQVVTFNIEQNPLTSTDFTTLSVTVRGDQGKVNKDTIKFSGLINMQAVGAPSLRFTNFIFRLGSVVVNGIIDQKGNVVAQNNRKLVLPDGSQFTAKINAQTGLITGTLTKATVATVLNNTAITDRGLTRLAFQVILSNNILAAETLEFSTHKVGNKLSLDYSIAKTGNTMGGNFQILSALGKDGLTISGTRGDAWHVKFMIIPRFGVDPNPGLDALTSLNVRIGQNFIQRIPATQFTSTRGGNITLLKPAVKGAEVVAKLTINTHKYIGSLDTFTLGSLSTFISPAADVAAPPKQVNGFPNAGVPPTSFTNTAFDLGIDVNRSGNNSSFIGEYGRFILGLPIKTEWVDKVNLGDKRPQVPAPPQSATN